MRAPLVILCWLAAVPLTGCGGDERTRSAGSGETSEGAARDAAEGGSEASEGEAGTGARPGRSFPPETGEDPRILIRETRLRVTPGASLHIAELLGRLKRLQEAPAWFDEPSSFAIRVERAETTMTGPDLAALMNEHVFAYEGAPLSGLSVEIRDGLLHLTLARSGGEAISAEGLQPSDPDAPHFLFFQGGEVRFDKLTMRATDLQLVDRDPEDPFDFYLKRLQDQLVAGVSLIQPDEGLLVVLPDYDELEAEGGSAPPP